MFKYVATFDGKQSDGTLRWDSDSYVAMSGPHGEGTLPVGTYDVKKRDVVTNPDMDKGYCIKDSQGKICFFIPLKPQFQTHRTGFGIHPDGNVPGSEGCVALDESETRSFWAKWNRTPMSQRPDTLEVEDANSKKKKTKKSEATKKTKPPKKAKPTKRAKTSRTAGKSKAAGRGKVPRRVAKKRH